MDQMNEIIKYTVESLRCDIHVIADFIRMKPDAISNYGKLVNDYIISCGIPKSHVPKFNGPWIGAINEDRLEVQTLFDTVYLYDPGSIDKLKIELEKSYMFVKEWYKTHTYLMTADDLPQLAADAFYTCHNKDLKKSLGPLYLIYA